MKRKKGRKRKNIESKGEGNERIRKEREKRRM